jgi:hypothetical protein
MEPGPRTILHDTSPEGERRRLEILRELGPAFGLEMTLALSWDTLRKELAGFDREHPNATPRERRDWLLRSRYGDEVADSYWEVCDRTGRDGCG